MHASDHNYAGLTPAERAKLEIDSSLERARARWDQIEKAAGNAPAEITSETEAENFTTVVAQLQALEKAIERAHDDVKEPYLTAGRVVDNVSKFLSDKVEQLRRTLQSRLTAYQVEKQRKIEEERKRIRDAEAEDPEPAWTNSTRQTLDKSRVKVRSVEGASAHLAQQTDLEIIDVREIPDRYLNRPKVLAALRSEILPDIRKGDDVPGVKRIDGFTSRVKA